MASEAGAASGLVNTGTILAPVAIDLGGIAHRILNLGLISGEVRLSLQSDLYDTRGGTTDGQVSGERGDDTLRGGAAADSMSGGAGADLIRGGGEDDLLAGDGQSDTIRGGSGDDTVRGGLDADDLDGGEGAHDLLDYADSSAAVTVDLGTREAIGGHAQGDAFTEFEDLGGSGFGDRLFGDRGANTLLGRGGNDLLAGGAGDDRLVGDAGDDFLTGGAGADTLRGGSGLDRFRLLTAAESGPTVATRDRVLDFSKAEGDLIDLFQIDADATTPGNQGFAFIGGAAFSAPGQIRVLQSAGDTFVLANVDANLAADLSIRLDGLIALSVTDFEL